MVNCVLVTFYADHTGFGQAQRNCNTGRKILIFGTDTHTHTHTHYCIMYIYIYIDIDIDIPAYRIEN